MTIPRNNYDAEFCEDAERTNKTMIDTTGSIASGAEFVERGWGKKQNNDV